MLRKTVCLAVLVTIFASTAEVEAQRRTPLRNLFRGAGVGWGAGNHWRNPGHDAGHYNSWSDQNGMQYQMNSFEGVISDGQFIQAPTDGQIIYQNAIPSQSSQPNQTPAQSNEGENSVVPTPAEGASPAIQDNSASRLLNQQRYQRSSTFQTSQPIQNQQRYIPRTQGQQNWTPNPQGQQIQNPQIQHRGTTSSIGDQTSIQTQQSQINRYLKPYHSNASSSKSSIQLNQGGQFQIAPSRTPSNNTGWSGK